MISIRYAKQICDRYTEIKAKMYTKERNIKIANSRKGKSLIKKASI